ncbi:type 4b pilus protein PilO2 [Xanthomonas campestris pv. campestris]|uniref:type 4b pilus protein PilO2 n=1 Tax=Xanthomonas campestris TaxID=339 RepID=UPI001E42AD7C|nr:type 4b pilus protein PilO2 [Xanthomonas campestris]MCD0253113.1 type 4b pilus protein PilO2 [Xanthomonas campestris pv. campestris]
MQISPSPLTVITVNGKSFVSGLTWKSLKKGRTFKAEAAAYGKEHNLEWVTYRSVDVLQAGFAPKTEHRTRGMYSLAGALAGQLGGNWIGVFALPHEQFVFVAVTGGAVMVRTDIVADQEHIEAEFNDVYNLLQSQSPSWTEKKGRVILPPGWDFALEHLTLEDILVPKEMRPEYRLTPLKFGLERRDWIIGGAMIALVLAAGAGYLKWQSVQDAKRAEQAKQEQQAAVLELQVAQAKQQALLEAERLKSLVKPWEQLPSAQTFIAACDAFWQETPLSLGGWLFANGQCGPGKAVATFKRTDHGTTVVEFANAARQRFNQQPSIFSAGTTGSIAAQFNTTAATNDQLLPTAEALEEFTAHLQAAGAATTFTIDEKPWSPPADKPDAIAPNWKTQAFSIKTNRSPAVVFEGLNTQGLRIFEITATLNESEASLNWDITGEIYGQ